MSEVLNDCGCCTGLTAETPAPVANRPGLPAIAYRVGTHSQFKRSMLAALSSVDRPALASLTSRANTDFAIALLDAAATLADVLTFYQERIANESYLRTAAERRSLVELARLIGYELRPGVAAETHLAFTVDETPGAPSEVVIEAGTKVQSVPGPGETPQTFETVEKITARAEWNALKVPMTRPWQAGPNTTSLRLRGTTTFLRPGDPILFIGPIGKDAVVPTWHNLRRISAVRPKPEANYVEIVWNEPLGSAAAREAVPFASLRVFGFHVRTSLFGANAPHPRSLSDEIRGHYSISGNSTDWPYLTEFQTVQFNTTYEGIAEGSWVVLADPESGKAAGMNHFPARDALYAASNVTEVARADYALSNRVTQLDLDRVHRRDRYSYRSITALAQSEELFPAEEFRTEAISSANVPLADPPSGLTQGQRLFALGTDPTGKPFSELVAVASVSGSSITVSPPLAKSCARESFSLNANVARATHGETVEEILGSGDTSQPNQQFTLRQTPLTHVQASTVGGARSTLEVRVNDLLWHEAPTLFGRGPREHVYTLRTDDNGRTTIAFGDGVNGARLPTGQENIRAKYRKGIGIAGNVKAGQLSLPLTRPLGVKAVTNPLEARGAQDRESLADARRNAPTTVRTLDRAVSLQDYEDFARGFAGIAKALATWTWDGQARHVFVTVAGPGGTPISPDSQVYRDLVSALRQFGDPFVPLTVRSYTRRSFDLAGRLTVDPDHPGGQVLAAVKAKLRDRFSFDARDFGQCVAFSEVISVIQGVPGTVAVNILRFYSTNDPPDVAVSRPAYLPAVLPQRLPNGAMGAAELLLVDESGLTDLREAV